MPKTLGWFLHSAALDWQMTGNAVLFHHGKTWHRYEGELPGWTDCGKWVPEGQIVRRVGRGCRSRSPWYGSGHVATGGLCFKCFASELPLLRLVEDAMADETGGR